MAAAALVAAALPVATGSAGAEEKPDAATAASVTNPQIQTGGLITYLDISPDLNCYAQLLGDVDGAFFGDDACATIMVVGDDSWAPARIPAGSAATSPSDDWVPVSQDVAGSGAPADPYRITTVVDAPSANLRLTQVDIHVVGDNFWTTEITVANQGGSPAEVEVYKAFDCYTADSDNGYGALFGNPVSAVQCIGEDSETGVRNRAETLVGVTPPSSYMEAFYSDIWAAAAAGNLSNTCICEQFEDNGLALGWELTIPAGGTSPTVVHRTEFRSPGQAVTNFRLLDTRRESTPETQIGYSGPIPAPGQTVPVQVAGRGGIPEGGAESVFLNVTGTESTGQGFVTVWPTGQPQPNSSSLNLEAGQTRPNLVFTRVGDGGQVNIFTQSGGHLIADVGAFFPTGSAVRALTNPERILDTRDAQIGYTGPKPGENGEVALRVLGVAGVPDDPAAVAGVILNVTGTEAEAPGFVTVWPEGQLRPNASNLNLAPGEFAAPNLVVVPVGADGSIRLYTQSPAHLIVDIAGYIVPDAGFESVTPFRVLDTRPGSAIGYDAENLGVPGPDAEVRFQVAGVEGSGVPAAGVQSVILNVTATESFDAGFITAYPGGARPEASNLNVERPGQTIPNSVIVPVDSSGFVTLYTQSGGHLLADVAAWIPN